MNNRRFDYLMYMSGLTADGVELGSYEQDAIRRLVELTVVECCLALTPMLRDMISRGQAIDLIKQHFEQPPGWVCSKCGIDRTRDVCPKGDMAAVSGDCPMKATAQTGRLE